VKVAERNHIGSIQGMVVPNPEFYEAAACSLKTVLDALGFDEKAQVVNAKAHGTSD
jgi:hypothetical protein